MNDSRASLRGAASDNLAAEGDVNLSPLRRAWEAEHLHGSTRKLLDADSRHYLHQSLSTPCLNALAACEGIWLTDVEGRRIMDFHGNNVHQVGYRHPHVIGRQAPARPPSVLAAALYQRHGGRARGAARIARARAIVQ